MRWSFASIRGGDASLPDPVCRESRPGDRGLLDAAHSTPDSALLGEVVVSNGVSLCRLHHAAFDRLLLGVHPSYVVHVRRDILEEVDGPMLRHGLRGFEGQRIWVPSRRVERPDEGSFWEGLSELGFVGLGAGIAGRSRHQSYVTWSNNKYRCLWLFPRLE